MVAVWAWPCISSFDAVASFVYVAPSENIASGPLENAFYFVLIADLNGTVLIFFLTGKAIN